MSPHPSVSLDMLDIMLCKWPKFDPIFIINMIFSLIMLICLHSVADPWAIYTRLQVLLVASEQAHCMISMRTRKGRLPLELPLLSASSSPLEAARLQEAVQRQNGFPEVNSQTAYAMHRSSI